MPITFHTFTNKLRAIESRTKRHKYLAQCPKFISQHPLNKEGNTLLLWAAKESLDMLLDLLTFETTPANEERYNPLLQSANIKNKQGDTLLHYLINQAVSGNENPIFLKPIEILLKDFNVNPFVVNAAKQTVSELFLTSCSQNSGPISKELFKLLNENFAFIGTATQSFSHHIGKNYTIFSFISPNTLSNNEVISEFFELFPKDFSTKYRWENIAPSVKFYKVNVLPKKLKSYADSYFLIGKELYYISKNGRAIAELNFEESKLGDLIRRRPTRMSSLGYFVEFNQEEIHSFLPQDSLLNQSIEKNLLNRLSQFLGAFNYYHLRKQYPEILELYIFLSAKESFRSGFNLCFDQKPSSPLVDVNFSQFELAYHHINKALEILETLQEEYPISYALTKDYKKCLYISSSSLSLTMLNLLLLAGLLGLAIYVSGLSDPNLFALSIVMIIVLCFCCCMISSVTLESIKQTCEMVSKELVFPELSAKDKSLLNELLQWMEDNEDYFNNDMIANFVMPMKLTHEESPQAIYEFTNTIKKGLHKLEEKLQDPSLKNLPLFAPLPQRFFSFRQRSTHKLQSENIIIINNDENTPLLMV